MNDEIDETADRRLREALRGATRVAEPLDSDPVIAVRQRVARRRTRRRSLALVATAALVLVTAGIVVTIDRVEDDTVELVSPSTEAEPTRSTRPVDSTTTAAPGTTAQPRPGGPPLAMRAGVGLAWTGKEVVVWGGNIEAANLGVPGPDRTFADGAAFNPATGAWRAMSSGPLPSGNVTPYAARTHHGVVIVRGKATAIWDPEADSWRELDDSPAFVTDLVAAGGLVLSHSANAVLDVETGTWRSLPDPPVRLERPTSVWTGNELIVIGGPNTPFTSAAALALDPSDRRWRTLPAPPTELHAEALSAAWDGARVVVVNYDMTAATFDPARNSWQQLPAVPARFSETSPTTLSAGGTTLTFLSQVIAVLREGDRWEPIPSAAVPYGRVVLLGEPGAGTDGRAAIWTTDYESKTNELSIVDLPALLASTRRRQVGVGSIELAPEDVVTSATYTEGGTSEAVRLVIQRPGGGECAVVSTYGVISPPVERPVGEELPGPRAWIHDPGGLVWQTQATESDQFRIVCDDAAESRRLATTAQFD